MLLVDPGLHVICDLLLLECLVEPVDGALELGAFFAFLGFCKLVSESAVL